MNTTKEGFRVLDTLEDALYWLCEADNYDVARFGQNEYGLTGRSVGGCYGMFTAEVFEELKNREFIDPTSHSGAHFTVSREAKKFYWQEIVK